MIPGSSHPGHFHPSMIRLRRMNMVLCVRAVSLTPHMIRLFSFWASGSVSFASHFSWPFSPIIGRSRSVPRWALTFLVQGTYVLA